MKYTYIYVYMLIHYVKWFDIYISAHLYRH